MRQTKVSEASLTSLSFQKQKQHQLIVATAARDFQVQVVSMLQKITVVKTIRLAKKKKQSPFSALDLIAASPFDDKTVLIA